MNPLWLLIICPASAAVGAVRGGEAGRRLGGTT